MFLEGAMTKKAEAKYEESESLRKILEQTLTGRKFRLDCGHHVTFGHNLGNDITIYNGKQLRIVCSLCGY